MIAALFRFLRILWLRWDVDSTERYMRECNPDGLLDSTSLRYFRADAEAKRVRLALLECERARAKGARLPTKPSSLCTDSAAGQPHGSAATDGASS